MTTGCNRCDGGRGWASARSSSKQKPEVCQAICAFANDLPRTGRPGVVVIGQRDDGTPRGPITDSLLLELADLRTNGGISPFPQISVRKLDLHGAAVAVVIVEPSASPPVRHDGRTYIRVGPSGRLATAGEEAILTERRHAANLPFDARPVASSTIDDLDFGRFREEILPQLIADDVLRENKLRSVRSASATAQERTVA